MENILEVAMEAIMANAKYSEKGPSIILSHLAEQSTAALSKSHIKLDRDYTKAVESMPNASMEKIKGLEESIRLNLVIGRKYTMQDFYMKLGGYANGVGRNFVYATIRQVCSSMPDSVFIETSDMYGKFFIVCQNRMMDNIYKSYKGFVKYTSTSFAEFIMSKKAYDMMHVKPEFILEQVLEACDFTEPMEVWRFKKWIEYYFMVIGGTVSFLNTEEGTQASGRHPNLKYFE